VSTLSLFRLILTRAVLITVVGLGLQGSSLVLDDVWRIAGFLARNYQFDYITWEVNALAAKTGQTLFGVHPFMSEGDRSAAVRAYMADLARVQSLEGQISTIYADSADPEADSSALREERNLLRASLDARSTLVEGILEGQAAAVLVEQGFGLAGQLVPPISARLVQMPMLLVTSPRDEIRFDISMSLTPMTVDEQAALETEIDETLDVSSLVVPLGGMALYPTMVIEYPSIPYTLEVFAHEWLHNYLIFFPLGFYALSDPETRIINETTASQFGKEIGRLATARYYPDLLPTQNDSSPEPADSASQTPPPFNFGAEMNETRVTVDELLAAGRVEDAEAYMEERRQVFVANGYLIRKLNQAYFAFYGGYQSPGGGAGGADPIGPAVAALRESSGSVYDWIAALRGVTTRVELVSAVGQ
jgi:hypothetical protein